MGTTTIPRRRGLSRRWLVILIVLVALAAVAVYVVTGAQSAETPAPATVPVTKGTLVATVAGSGSVSAEQSLGLAFQTAGTVTEVLVKEGDTVQSGQVLAKLDDRNLQLQVASAQSGLDSAKARLTQAQQGNAKPPDLAAARAAVASAQASYDKVANGPASADVAAAQAAVGSAQAAQAAYDAAVAAANTMGSQLLAAQAALAKAEAAVQKAQGDYDRVAYMPNIGSRPEALALQSATIDYEQAKANYEALQSTASVDAKSRVDSAAAQLAQAQANLAKLTPKAEDIAAAKAVLDQAQANLAKLTAAGTATDLQIQQAAVSQAEQSLKQAQLALDNATLKAPFASVVTQVNISAGSLASGASPAFYLINRNPLHVDLRLSENDVAKVQLGQPVSITVPSLNNWGTDGKVTYVAPAAENVSGVVTYVVRVSFPDSEPQVKVGMTSDLSIEVARKENVLMVPSTALLPKGTGRVVQVLDDSAGSGQNGRPGVREVGVQVGLSDGTNTEIIGGLTEGQQVVALPDSGVRSGLSGSLFGGQ
ncbi:MAG: efflux RND transporter periplasmic adaptor subunit [Dehalococcoidales bacterium]|nr:efflux RND transporter periplasmic adaptor subunit [Dehalococcoidales bacterium]